MSESGNTAKDQIVVFTLDEQSYALFLRVVVKVMFLLQYSIYERICDKFFNKIN